MSLAVRYSAKQKMVAFSPQILGWSIATACIVIGQVTAAHAALTAALVCVGLPAGIASLVTIIAKATTVMDDGWDKVIGQTGECKKCTAREKDLAELRPALATLRIEGDR